MSDAAPANAQPGDDLPPGAVPLDDLPPGAQPIDDLPPGATPIDAAAPQSDIPSRNLPAVDDMRLVPLVVDEDEERARDAEVKGLFDVGITKAPDKWAGVLEFAKSSGAPVQIVEDRYDEFKLSAERAKHDPRKWRTENPGLYDLLIENPKLAPIVFKEKKLQEFSRAVMKEPEGLPLWAQALGAAASSMTNPSGLSGNDSLKTVEKQPDRPPEFEALQPTNLNGPLDIAADVFSRQRKQSEISSLGTKQIYLDARAMLADANDPKAVESARRAAYENRKKVLGIQQDIGLPKDYQTGALGDLGIVATEALGSQVDSLKAYGAGAAAGAVVAGGATAALTRSPAAAAAAARGGAALVAKIAGFASSFNQEAGSSYLEFRDARDDQGELMDPVVAMGAAAVYGLAAAGVEVATIGPMLKAFGIGAGAAGAEAKTAIRKVAMDHSKQAMLREFGKAWAESAASEGAEEGVQSLLQFAANWAGRSISAGSAQSADLDAATREALVAAGKGAVGAGLGLGGLQATTTLVGNVMRMQSSQRAVGRVQAIAEVANTEAAKVAPEQVAKIIETETHRSGQRVTSLYVDPVKLTEAIKAQGGDPDATARELLGPDGPERIRLATMETVDTKGSRATLEVPVKEYAERWGGHPVAALVQEDTTVNPSHWTARELADANEEVAALREQADAIVRDHEASQEPAPVDPASLEQIKQSFGSLSESQQTRAYFTDRNTGLLNLRGMEATPRDAARPFLAEWDLEGGKFINDRHGHEALDGAYRAMAQALEAAGIKDGGKVGGSVRAWVKDEAHAQEIAQAMKAAIDPRLQVTAAAAKSVGTVQQTIEASSAAHKQVKGALFKEGKLGHRKGAPASFMEGQQVAFEPDMKGVAPTSPDVVARLDKAATELAPVAEKLRAAASVTGTQIAQEHAASFGEQQAVAFDTIHREASGLLTDDGWRAARELNPKAFVMSADLRAFKEMNEAFGREGTDALNQYFGEVLHELGGGEFDTAHPHGDEYAAQHDDEAKLRRFFDAAREITDGTVFTSKRADGSFVVQKGLSFAYAVDRSFDIADRVKLPDAKREQDTAGVSKPEFLDAESFRRRIAEIRRDHPDYKWVGVESLLEGRNQAKNRRGRGASRQEVATPASAIVQREAQAMGISEPLFRSPADAGMTGEQFDAYLKEREEATKRSVLSLERRVAAIDAKTKTDEWKAEVYKNISAAEWEFEKRPDWRALRYLKAGEVLTQMGRIVKVAGVGKLDRTAVREALGDAHPAEELLGNRLVQGGEDPSDAATRLGFPSVRAIFDAIAAVPDRAKTIRARAEQMALEQHPEVMDEANRLNEVAQKSLHNEGNSGWLLKEWAALRRKANAPGAPPLESIKIAATDIVGKRPVRRLDVGQTLKQERAAANKAFETAAKGNYQQAYVFKQQQLLKHFMWRELDQAGEDRDAFTDLAKKLSSDKYRERLGKAGAPYRDVVDSILESLELTPPREQETQRQGIDALVRAMEENGDTVAFDADAVGAIVAKPRPWSTLSVNEMRSVLTALKNIKKAATNRNTAIVDGRRHNRDTIISQLLGEAQNNLPAKPPPPSSRAAMSMVQRGMSIANSFDGWLLKPQTMLEWLGGESIDSMWHKAIIKPLQQAKAREADLMRSAVRPVIEAFEKVPANIRKRLMEKIDGAELFPTHRQDLQPPSIRLELLMMALHRGNESNLQRLLEGRGITLEQLDRALGKLTRQELEWVQSVWDASESLWPLSRDLEERDSGVAPEKIQPTPFAVRTEGGDVAHLKGGYFPAVYDRRVSEVGERQAARTAADLMDPSYVRPGTSRGHLKSRSDNFADALSLDPAVIQSHLIKQTHDIAFREALRSAGGILMDPKVQATMKQRLGDERAGTFLQWLKDVGRMDGASADAHAGALAKLARGIKSNMVIGTLGWALDNFVGDFTNLAVAPIGSKLKTKHLASSLFEFAKSPLKVREFSMEKSGELRQRGDNMRVEFEHQLKSMTRSGKLPARAISWFRDNAFLIAEEIDKATATPIWYGAYRQAVADGHSDADAVEFANIVLQQTMPSHSVVDKSAMQRDKGFLGSVVAFQGYMNVLYQLQRRFWQPVLAANGASAKLGRIPKALAQQMALGTVAGVFAELLVGHGPEPGDGDDDDERWQNWFMRKMLISTIAPVPFIAGMAESWMMGKKPSMRAAPVFSVMDSIGKAAFKAWNEDEDGAAAAWEVAKAVGLLTGIPTRPMRAAQFLQRYFEGETENQTPAGAAGGVLYGERENQPLNPITLIAGQN